MKKDNESPYAKLLEITEDGKVELGLRFKDLLHTHLVFGQTRYVCRNGTLSDGHEKVTDAQKYYAAIKEIFLLSQNVRSTRSQAKIAQAELIEAEMQYEKVTKPNPVRFLSYLFNPRLKKADLLKAEARLEIVNEKLLNFLTQAEDQMRMIDEYHKIRMELHDKVEAKYPGGIEEAEQDNWEAVYKYRMMKEMAGIRTERTDNIPLPPEDKARLGLQYKRMDSIAPLAIANDKPFTPDMLPGLQTTEAMIEHLTTPKDDGSLDQIVSEEDKD